jgi:hypothetical protein
MDYRWYTIDHETGTVLGIHRKLVVADKIARGSLSETGEFGIVVARGEFGLQKGEAVELKMETQHSVGDWGSLDDPTWVALRKG